MKMNYHIQVFMPENLQPIIDEVTSQYHGQPVTETLLQKIREEIVEKVKFSISVVLEQGPLQ